MGFHFNPRATPWRGALAVLEGHKGRIVDVQELADGRILSWSKVNVRLLNTLLTQCLDEWSSSRLQVQVGKVWNLGAPTKITPAVLLLVQQSNWLDGALASWAGDATTPSKIIAFAPNGGAYSLDS